jgi:hypothetical protein
MPIADAMVVVDEVDPHVHGAKSTRHHNATRHALLTYF